jgi:hypothetical protein
VFLKLPLPYSIYNDKEQNCLNLKGAYIRDKIKADIIKNIVVV